MVSYIIKIDLLIGVDLVLFVFFFIVLNKCE